MLSLEWLAIIFILPYASIAYELLCLPVPSVASTYQLFFAEQTKSAMGKQIDQLAQPSLLTKVHNLPLALKVFFLLVPTAVCVVNFCAPIALLLVPENLRDAILIPELAGSVGTIIGLALIVLGRCLSLYSVIVIRHQNAQVGDSFDLKTSGLFGVSRNPILIGMYCCYWGIFALLPNWIMLLGFLIYAANMHFRILLEEAFLAAFFGAPFKEYIGKTRRYL